MKIFRYITLFLFFIPGMISAQAQDTGILIMAHGGGEEWNQQVVEAAKPLSEKYAVEFAWGMSNYVTLQNGIDRLEAKQVKRIIAVPLFISSYSPIIRQTEYLFGLRDSLADRPMPLMHHSDKYLAMTNTEADPSDYKGHMLMPPNLQPLKVNKEVKIVMTKALDDHDVVAQILRDRILSLSNNPSNETVVLVAHGPNDEGDNAKWVANLESLSQKIQQYQLQQEGGKGFKQIFSMTVRDDANATVHDQAKAQLRAVVRQADFFGDVIVVPVFLSSGGREQAVAERLEGLHFKWSGETLLPDAKLSDFLVKSVEAAL